METDKNKFVPINWNAGKEYTEIIKTIKENYIIAELSQDYEAALATLSTDFDFSYAKILAQAIKFKKSDRVKEKAKKIRTLIDNTRNFCHNKKSNPNYNYHVINKLNIIKRLVWDMQGEFGVLYPYEEKQDENPGDAVKRGFS